MAELNLVFLAFWFRHAAVLLPIAVALVSIVILFGCAIASWIAPSEKTDCIFHREVI